MQRGAPIALGARSRWSAWQCVAIRGARSRDIYHSAGHLVWPRGLRDADQLRRICAISQRERPMADE